MALDTSVSIKYETDYGECISQVTGTDLCLKHDIFMGLTYGCGILFFLLLIFNKRILKKTDKI